MNGFKGSYRIGKGHIPCYTGTQMLLAPKYIPRLAATVGLFTRYGLKDFANSQGLRALVPGEYEDDDGAGPTPLEERAVAFRKRLVALGPAYVKLGQVLSTRPDLVPAEYIVELTRLHDDVGRITLDEVEQTIEQELGARISKLFSTFDEEPLATASLGQVHGAELRDGRSVVVKVQRPHIRKVLADDIEFFDEFARFLTSHTEMGVRVDLVGVVQQLERALQDELDYRIEARNAAMLRRALAEFPRVLIPRVIEAYTTEKVLTMERIRGVKIDQIPAVARIERDFHPVADEISKAYLKQITIDGHFHADPHPGNLFVVFSDDENPRTPAEVVATDRRGEPRAALTPLSRIEQAAQKAAKKAAPILGEAEEIDVRVALVDFGMTARLSDAMKDRVVNLLMAVADNRGDDVAETMIEMGDPVEGFDRNGYVREIAQLVARNYDLSIGEVQAGTVLFEVINASYQSGLRLPAELTLLAKTLFNLDAVTRALDPTYSPIHAIQEYTSKIANERARREFTPRRIFQLVSQAQELLTVLPHRIDVITNRMATNDLGLNVQVEQLPALTKALEKVANRIYTGLVLAGLLLGSAWLYPHSKAIGMAGFIISGVLALYMVGSILIQDRRNR